MQVSDAESIKATDSCSLVDRTTKYIPSVIHDNDSDSVGTLSWGHHRHLVTIIAENTKVHTESSIHNQLISNTTTLRWKSPVKRVCAGEDHDDRLTIATKTTKARVKLQRSGQGRSI